MDWLLGQPRTIQVCVPPFWLCFVDSIPVDGAEIPIWTDNKISVIEPAWLPGSYEEALRRCKCSGALPRLRSISSRCSGKEPAPEMSREADRPDSNETWERRKSSLRHGWRNVPRPRQLREVKRIMGTKMGTYPERINISIWATACAPTPPLTQQ